MQDLKDSYLNQIESLNEDLKVQKQESIKLVNK